jgi:TRAP-type mannitol/chloroaromatic compound transport system permease small subunit
MAGENNGEASQDRIGIPLWLVKLFLEYSFFLLVLTALHLNKFR